MKLRWGSQREGTLKGMVGRETLAVLDFCCRYDGLLEGPIRDVL